MDGRDDQKLGLGLFPAGMLRPDDPRGFVVEAVGGRGGGVRLKTGYFCIVVHANPVVQPDGEVKILTQLELDSQPAFEVLCVKPSGADVHVILIEKQRMGNAFHRGKDLPLITKIPGGYDHTGQGVTLDVICQRLLQETGIEIGLAGLHCIGLAVGHTEIRTPIGLWYCTDWRHTQEPRPGVNILEITLEEALELADNAVQRTPGVKRIENETGVELLYLFERMYRRHEIDLGDLGQPPLQMGKPLSILPT